ncbi:histidinol-phosphate transaminase [Bacillus songklensis]|uniref:Histidinol-phosphate aminotransferase n=1 Tax=Bacillus songklensis TaxID=1069116 RepID=A0ABV8B999_9BACI
MNIQSVVRNVYPNLTPYICQLADLPIEELKEALQKETVYKLSFNENPLGPSPKALKAMGEALQSLNLYPSSKGEKLQEAIAQREGVQRDQVLLSNGADEMINLAAQTFLEPGDEVVIPAVTFVQYEAAAHLMGAVPVKVPMTGKLEIDLEGIIQAITTETKMICLCNPNNPTGAIISDKQMGAFLKRVPKDVVVIIDEAYYEYADSSEFSTAVKYIKNHENVLVVRTFSKIYSLAAARIGYGIGNETLVEAIHHVRPPFNVNAIAQAGALASLNDQEHVQVSKQLNEKGKQLLYETFEQLGFEYVKTNGNFVYVDTKIDSDHLFQELAKKGVIVRILKGYGLPASLRVSVGAEEEVKAFIQALNEIL